MKVLYPRKNFGQIFFGSILGVLLISLFVAFLGGCASKGLLPERYEPDFYRVPQLLPEGPMSKNPTFIVYGDTQAAWRVYDKFIKKESWWTWKMLIFPFYEVVWLGNGVVGTVNLMRRMPDYGKRTRKMMRDAVYAESKRSVVDFILNTGDMVANDGRRTDHWALFLQENKHQHPLLNEVPYLPTVGNHDRVSDPRYGRPNYEAVFGYPPFYTLEFPDVALFVVDTNLIMDWRQEIEDDVQDELFEKWFVSGDPGHPAWLERALASCNKPFKVLSMHHSPLFFGYHWTDWTKPSYGRDNPQKRRRLLRLLQEHGVQVVFSGHDHIYQHNVLRHSTKDSLGVEEIHFIVSSGGGVPLRDPKSDEEMERIRQYYLEEGFEVEPLMQEKVFHYCLVQVDSSEMRIRTFEVARDGDEPPGLLEEIVVSKIEKPS